MSNKHTGDRPVLAFLAVLASSAATGLLLVIAHKKFYCFPISVWIGLVVVLATFAILIHVVTRRTRNRRSRLGLVSSWLRGVFRKPGSAYDGSRAIDGIYSVKVPKSPQYLGTMILERGVLFYANNEYEFGIGAYTESNGSIAVASQLWSLTQNGTPEKLRTVRSIGRWFPETKILELTSIGSGSPRRAADLICERLDNI